MTLETNEPKQEILKVVLHKYSFIVYTFVPSSLKQEDIRASLPQKGPTFILPRFEIKIVKRAT